jgi:WD40 repeat protein
VLGDSRFKTGHWIFDLAVSPDARTVAGASADETTRLWDAATGEERAVFRGWRGTCFSVAFSNDGRLLAAGGGPANTTVKVWEQTSGKLLATLPGHEREIVRLAFSPDDKVLAAGVGSSFKVWEVATGRLLHTLPGDWPTFGRGGRTLAAIVQGATVKFWDVDSGREVGSWGCKVNLGGPAFSPDLKTVTIQPPERPGTLELVDVTTGQVRQKFRAHPVLVSATAFSADGKTLATAGNQVVRIWDGATRQEVRHFPGLPIVSAIAYSPDGQWLAELQYGEQSTVMLWRMSEDNPQPTTLNVPTPVRSIAFTPEGRHLATTNGTNTVYVFRLAPPPL